MKTNRFEEMSEIDLASEYNGSEFQKSEAHTI